MASDVATWYSSLFPYHLDLIQDYAGDEPFLIDADSLLRYILSSPLLDLDPGLQCLHAIHALENFLHNLRQRRCVFHVVFFEEHREFCVGPGRDAATVELLRGVVRRHLEGVMGSDKREGECAVYAFRGMASDEFKDYRERRRPYFVMCHDGENVGEDETTEVGIRMKEMVRRFMMLGFHVALINHVEFVDSKIYTNVVKEHFDDEEDNVKLLDLPERTLVAPPQLPESLASVRERVTVATLAKLLEENKDTKVAALYLLHLAFLNHLSLDQRAYRCSEKTLRSAAEAAGTAEFLKAFLAIAKDIVESDDVTNGSTRDIHDLVDGRLLLKLAMQSVEVPEVVSQDFERLAGALAELGAPKLTIEEAGVGSVADKVEKDENDEDDLPQRKPHLLPFSNQIIDPYLEELKLSEDVIIQEDMEDVDDEEDELYHWENAAKSQPSKRVLIRAPVPQAGSAKTATRFMHRNQRRALAKARRKDQKYFSQMTRYAQSLTGGMLAPEKIIADPTGTNQKKKLEKEKESKASKKENPAKGKGKPGSGGGGKPGSGGGKKGKEPKLSKAEMIKLKNAEEKAGKGGEQLLKSWTIVWRELAKSKDEEAAVNRLEEFLKKVQKAIPNAKTSLLATESHDGFFIEAEVRLHRIMLLQSMWARFCRENKKDDGYPLVAHLFDDARKILNGRGLTVAIKKILQNVFAGLGIAMPPAPKATPPERKLNFVTKWIGKIDEDTSLGMTSEEFQLLHFGPFMDRNMDSAPDERCSFDPDAWQRRVLDEIDQDHSVFVVAPTSAGKTFISFHAMKKVLKSDDSGILVYLAPTKALVNQIAAEVISRFSKDYHHRTGGDTVWAIHTGDYRMNKPDKCQILITVPHILSTMLLSPDKAKAWAPRLKRIIFDEAHSIAGEDGVVWEQLLLLAPCPIIALSATVGNPQEFSEWLESSQKIHQHPFTMIQHPHRYSDLRKFNYLPAQEESWKSFKKLGKLTKFGSIDQADGIIPIHPVSALDNPEHGMPDDLTLEPRDCLTLYKVMHELQTEDYKLPTSLNPQKVFGKEGKVIKKADVIVWEADLKSVLRKWMQEYKTSPFLQVVKKLGGRRLSEEPKLLALNGANADEPKVVHDDDLGELIEAEKDEYVEKHGEKAAYLRDKTLPLLQSLHMANALPAILFSYDREMCEFLGKNLIAQLKLAEEQWRASDPKWKALVKQWEDYQIKQKNNKFKRPRVVEGTKADQAREEAETEGSFLDSFDPEDPSAEFSFADFKKHTKSELETDLKELEPEWLGIAPWLLHGLKRGIGIHHAGMNRRYRQAVEMLFRKGYLRVVIATGTLSLGINMPCKTVVFAGDSVYLTALNYRQAAGRAGRRGFDLLGNVVFHGFQYQKIHRLMSSRLPSLMGHFPVSNSLVLRLFTLLKNSNDSEHAKGLISSLLAQPRLVLGGESSHHQVLHHLRFAIEFLRRQKLLSATGAPINFAVITGHLYYTEAAAFAFHALLASGYIGQICKDWNPKTPGPVLDKLMLVLSHIFGRRTCTKGSGIKTLPPMPKEAAEIIENQNRETLDVYTAYVTTFAKEYVDKADNTLPFSQVNCGGKGVDNVNISNIHKDARSAFVALSGHDDRFHSIDDLTSSLRPGVFANGASVPYLDISSPAPVNGYLYEFFKHGNLHKMTTEHNIWPGERWFLLKDFSVILATIITGLVVYVRDGPTTYFDPSSLGGEEEGAGTETTDESKGVPLEEEDETTEDMVIEKRDKAPEELVNVLQAMRGLQTVFEEKFRNINA